MRKDQETGTLFVGGQAILLLVFTVPEIKEGWGFMPYLQERESVGYEGFDGLTESVN